MKTKFRIWSLCALTFIVAESARAGLYTENFGGGTVPEGGNNPASVTPFAGQVSDIPAGDTVGGLTVTLNITSGLYGNLYAQLESPNGTVVELLGSHTGSTYYGIGGSAGDSFGNTGSGTVTLMLADGGTAIPDGLSLSSGTYSATGTLAGFNGSTADGTWNLLAFDVDSGDAGNTLNSWSLGITAVPEPVTQALIIFGAVSLLIHFGRWCRLRLRDRRLR
jgi:hypothetical protein